MTRIPPPTEPEVVHISRRQIYKDGLENDKPPIRYANMDLSPAPQKIVYQLATIKRKLVLRETDAGRRNLQATFLETDRRISGLSLNLFTESTGNFHPTGSVSLWGEEIEALIKFIETMKNIKISGAGKLVVEPGAIDHPHFISDSDVTRALREKPELLHQVLENPDLSKDMKAIGYWRNSLKKFEKLLNHLGFYSPQLAANIGE